MSSAPAMVARVPSPRSFLAFDFGIKRVGVASGNSLTRSAQPVSTVAALGDERFAAIARLIQEWSQGVYVAVVQEERVDG